MSHNHLFNVLKLYIWSTILSLKIVFNYHPSKSLVHHKVLWLRMHPSFIIQQVTSFWSSHPQSSWSSKLHHPLVLHIINCHSQYSHILIYSNGNSWNVVVTLSQTLTTIIKAITDLKNMSYVKARWCDESLICIWILVTQSLALTWCGTLCRKFPLKW
jgi:hypothetical protein